MTTAQACKKQGGTMPACDTMHAHECRNGKFRNPTAAGLCPCDCHKGNLPAPKPRS